ncbi:MAG: quinone oxidoreductase [Bacteroidota bacterium]
MPEAIVVRSYGGPDVLQLEAIPTPQVGSGELLIQQTAIGINFHDIYCRSGLYKTLSLPGTPGIEGVGIVMEMGSEVKGFAKGDKVGYITKSYDGYSSVRTLDAKLAIPIPPSFDDALVASVLLKGLTVHMLSRQVSKIKNGNRILIHAAAGGVGQLLVQVAKKMGAMVIGTVGSEAKAEIARQAGCDRIILYRQENVYDQVMEFTKGKGLHQVFDSVGKDTFFSSLESLAPTGHLINFGQSSGPIKGFEIPMLAKKSITLSRPMLFHYTNERINLLGMSQWLFEGLANGELKAPKPELLLLKDAAIAHELLESRKALSPIVLIP